MKFEMIKEKIEELNKKTKSRMHNVKLIEELLELDKPLTEIEKDLEVIGLSLDDFYYTGFSIYPFRFVKAVTMMDLHSISIEEINAYQLVERANHQTEHAIELLREDDFDSFISFLDKRMKLDALKVFYEYIPSNERYDIFREVYTRMEYNFQDDREFIINCFKDRFGSQEWNKGMLELYLKYNGQKSLTIYRGEGKKSTVYHEAFSWTLDKKVAEFFANRFNGDGDIYVANVEFDKVVDFITYRNENEIIVMAEDLTGVKLIKEGSY